MNQLIAKASTLLEALPYIQRFRGETFVTKYGGSFMDSSDPTIRSSVARDIVFLEAVGINPVVVHGGGKAITQALADSGVETKFEQGYRVTTQESVKVVEQVLSQKINPDIVEMINQHGGKACGFSGTEIFKCRPFKPLSHTGEPVDIGLVGEVTNVNTEPLRKCIEQDITPVISPTAVGEDGQIYNCNADVAAGQTAISLRPKRLVYMSDVPGLLKNPNDPNSVISHLPVKEIEVLKNNGIISKGMIPKADSAIQALAAGVEKVFFIDGRMNHSLLLEIFTDAGVGTEIVQE
ncbi:MAG: acetylglutamate kinase [Verrucomicrobiota bacterium]|nr:acetylglutamate kinase [Verrucomicrobiales bacterium]MEC7882876.1 acetylglutamate kinase [Verrucomicrobiota bacterium]MED5454003.1 acetylglutamate kinase [Verrucomicrobiota bacterium]|tara:strand:+ start:876 stop:1754 length:879 start_codon:yes stop_codon:yes gene_type:complete